MRRSRLARPPNANVKTAYFPLRGGLNLVDAPMAIPDGMVIGAYNYECLSRDGYRRIDGFERYDGQPAPDTASYWILDFQGKDNAVSEGDIVTGGTSGATGEALIDEVIEGSGTNLLTFTEAFDNGVWAKSQVTVTPDAVANPLSATVNADKLIPTAVSGIHRINHSSVTVTAGSHVYSIYAKSAGYDYLAFYCWSATSGFFCDARFKLDDGTIDGNNAGIAAIEAVGDGWYRCSIIGTTVDTSVICYVEPRETAATTYTGDGTSGIYAWGVQLDDDTELNPYVIESGSYGHYVLTNVSGTFQRGEDLEVSAVKQSVAYEDAVERDADTTTLDTLYLRDALETQRDKIGTVGGASSSGTVRGVNIYLGDVYAIRDNLAVTAGEIWKATASGWVKQDLGNYVNFTAGTAEFLEGETLTQTGTTATILRVVLLTGTWAGADAAGYLVIGPVTSGPYAAGVATSASGSATLSGAETANALPPGGRYEFKNYNFFGTSGSFRMYGVNGVGTAFEYDGTAFVPIFTGNTNDTPTHLEINEYHLMLAFEKGSLQNSATGTPYDWAGTGVAEIGCGDEIVGLKKEIGSALAVICRNRTFALFGKNTTESPWDLRTISDESGGIEWTLQRVGATRYLDDRGFTRMDAVDTYGDFKDSVYSQLIEPLVFQQKVTAISSVIIKSKNQLRTFFEDGTAIIATFEANKLAGFSQLRYVDASNDAVPARCTVNGEDSAGNEIMFFGSDNGYLYQMDKGTSFDGSPISSAIVLNYQHLGSPEYDKQFKKVTMEIEGGGGFDINYTTVFDYSRGNAPVGITLQEELRETGGYWDVDKWGQFAWSSGDVNRAEGNIDGVGRNISLQMSSTATYAPSHTIYGITYHYIPRKLRR